MRRASTDKRRDAVTQVRRGRKAQGRRYPADLRQQIVAHVVSARSKGVSVRSSAASLGLSYPTLQGWLQTAPKGFRSVAVKEATPERETRAMRLVTAQGHRVEGLNREDVAFLLQSLT
jgi:transposase-like protein